MSYKVVVRDIETGEKIKLTPEEYQQYKIKHSIKDKLADSLLESKATPLHSGRGLGVRKIDDSFKDVLKNISKRNPRNKMNIP